MLQGHCFGLRLHPFQPESHHAKFQINPLNNCRDIGFRVFRDPAALHGILQCCRVTALALDLILFNSGSFPNSESSCKYSAHSKEKWLVYKLVRDSAALHGILQCCRVTVFARDLILSTQRVIMQNFRSIR